MLERGPHFDVDAWAQATFAVHNADGGRGYERGVRVIDCSFHDDRTQSAWVNVVTGWVACFNPACDAHDGMNAVEAIRRLQGFRTWTEALHWARREFPATGLEMPSVPPLPAYKDWCELPQGVRPIPATGAAYWTRTRPSFLLDEVRAFAKRQWGLSVADLVRWGCRYCFAGRYAWRVVIPITMGGRLVAFQARSYRNGEPKYLTSKFGKWGEPGAECGRPAEA